MSVATNSVTGFRGTLIRQEPVPGKHSVKLFFHTDHGTRLSLTRDFKLARSLRTGNEYQVSGQAMAVGERLCVVDPVAKRTGWRGMIRTYAAAIVIALVFLLGGSAYGLYTLATDTPKANQTATQSQANVAETSPVPESASSEATLGVNTTDQPTPPPVTPAPTSRTTRRSTTTPSTAAAPAASDSTQPSTPVIEPQTTPDPTPPPVEPLPAPTPDPTPPPPPPPTPGPEYPQQVL